ncbi:MAG: HDOD domain-containing protein [Planctomycetota bacterium]|nr:HDOD domain-containing protein [Planctomycetales bacterium]RLT07389.1 MAG: HDOD domain-containing protein [Planctomycetota bacterium]
MSATLKLKPAVRSETIEEALLALQSGENCELPVLPEVAVQLLKLTSDVDCNVGDIVSLIKRDQSLTGHLLRIANSLRYNTGVRVSSVQQATARLGLLAVREVVVLISCQCRVFDVPEFEAQVRQSFRYSLATAAFAQEIARVRRMNVEEAFLTGLLHDVGRPILLQAFVDRRRTHGLVASEVDVLRVAGEFRISFAEKLIVQWEISQRVAEAVRYQQAPQDAPTCVFQAAILNLAMSLAFDILNPSAPPPAEDQPHPMLEVLSIYPEQFVTIQKNSNQILEWVDSTA